MKRHIVLDSTPLSLLTAPHGVVEAEACRAWLSSQMGLGRAIVVPEIVDYELRRELIRLRKRESIARLDEFIARPAVQYLPVTTAALRLAADLWASVRQKGMPTADPKALDVDVILAAQVLATGLQPSEFVVATSNPIHLSRFVPAELWPSA